MHFIITFAFSAARDVHHLNLRIFSESRGIAIIASLREKMCIMCNSARAIFADAVIECTTLTLTRRNNESDSGGI